MVVVRTGCEFGAGRTAEAEQHPGVAEQLDMFGAAEMPAPMAQKQELMIGRAGDKSLSKLQQAFNRWVRRIEKLRGEITTSQAKLDRNLSFYVAELKPLEDAIAQRQKEMVLLLVPFLSRRDLGPKRNRNLLKDFIRQQITAVLNHFGKLDSPELKAAFKLVTGKSVEEVDRENFEAERDEMQDVFEAMGVDVDLSDFHPEMGPEELARKIAEAQARVMDAASKGPDTQDKSPSGSKRVRDKEAREQAAEELRTKDLGRLYKHLAKLLHPDLEQDPKLHQEKETAMKVLTTAYADKDLHTMLRLELEWMVREQADAAHLTDEKLKVYNSVLKEQVEELEIELGNLQEHPRYNPLRRYASGPWTLRGFDGYKIRQLLTDHDKRDERRMNALKSDRAFAELKWILDDFGQQPGTSRAFKAIVSDWT